MKGKWNWVRVNRKLRCPICDHPDWCTMAAEHQTVCCMRVQSSKPAHNGGWLHPLGDVQIPVQTQKAERPRPNLTALHRISLKNTPTLAVVRLSRLLGVSVASLVALGAAWQPARKAWLFPMRDAYGEIIGLRCRSEDGRKWAVTGSRNGLFIPDSMIFNGELWICEGPTDTAAALDLHHCAVGRPDCTGGCECLKRFVRKQKVTKAVIVADADKAGQDGAHRLARQLGIGCRIWSPPAKDLREWYRNGGRV